ncbi:hypothetical protein F5B20DRAFT_575426 [Whalleya microplaca]|nr:hypothetical protein F5B20DRAFT_575426 [Whalleya microplaca]
MEAITEVKKRRKEHDDEESTTTWQNAVGFDESPIAELPGDCSFPFEGENEHLPIAFRPNCPTDEVAGSQLGKRVLPPLKSHTQAEWEAVKVIIEEYYIHQNYTLLNLMDILSKEPWNFRASQKMFKIQFKRWGFEKNVTAKRVLGIFNTDALKDSARKVMGTDRIERYIKRKKRQKTKGELSPTDDGDETVDDTKKVTSNQVPSNDSEPEHSTLQPLDFEHSNSDIPELMETEIHITKHETTSVKCPFARPGESKFRISVHDSTELEDEYVAQWPSRETCLYMADSWGSHLYHDVKWRHCYKRGCQCRWLGPDSHAFRVLIQPKKIGVRILSPDLFSTVISIAKPCREDVEMVHPSTLEDLGTCPEMIDGVALLRSYRRLKEYLSHPDDFVGSPGAKMRQELQLLVEGFLEDGDIWHPFGYEELHSSGIIDKELMSLFMNQRLTRSIQALDSGFQAQEREANIAGTHFMPSSKQSNTFEHFKLPSPSSTNLNSFRNEEISTKNDSSTMGYDDLNMYGFIPINYNITSFYRNLPQDLPPLQQISSGQPIQLVAPGTIDSGFGTLDSPAELCGEWHSQAELDNILFHACCSGETKTVRSFIALGADVNAYTVCRGSKCTPLIASVENDHEEVSLLLIEAGANIDLRAHSYKPGESLDYTPLYAAVELGSLSLTKSLLDLGANIEAPSTFQTMDRTSHITALTKAASDNKQELFNLLLTWDTTFQAGLKSLRIVGPGDSQNARKTNNLITAASSGNISGVIEALRNGVDINAVSFRGSALSAATRKKKDHVVRLLLEYGADAQVASLYLTRSGLQETAKRLLKMSYGGGTVFENLRQRFIRQYNRISRICAESNAINLRTFTQQHGHYNSAWSTGIDIMKNICKGNAPTEVSDTVAFLAVARAIAETLVGTGGQMALLDKFDNDLLRWQQLFPFEEDVTSYRQVAQLIWGVQLSETSFYDTDNEDQYTLGCFRDLISTLINGAREPLGLDGLLDVGLEASLSRWRKRKPSPVNVVPNSQPNSSNPLNDTHNPGSSVLQRGLWDHQPSLLHLESHLPRSPAASSGGPDNPANHSYTVWLTGTTGVAEFLIRGAIFAITFIFLQGIQSLLARSEVPWGCSIKVGTLAQRMSAFCGCFRPPSASSSFISSNYQMNISTDFLGAITPPPPQPNCAFEKPSQWYGLLSGSSCWM